MAKITGQLTDFGFNALPGRNLKLYFRHVTPGVANGRIMSTREIEVVPAYNGYFEADLTPAAAIAPAGYYIVTLEWTEYPNRKQREVFPGRLYVPANGGILANLLRVPENPALVWTGTEPPANPSPGSWWQTPAGDVYEWAGTGWNFKVNLRGPAGYSSTSAAGDDSAIARFLDAAAGPTATNSVFLKLLTRNRPANVKDAPYGAKGDNTTDDTAAINRALATDLDVYLPPGRYLVTAAAGYALKNNQKKRIIYGAGQALTTIRISADGDGGVIDATGAILCDLAIDGGHNPAQTRANLFSCVQANSGSTVRNVHVYNARGSCLVGVGSRISFLNNRLERFGDHAIYSSGNISDTAPYAAEALSSRVVIAGNIIDDDVTYHNDPSSGTNRGAIKLRNNVQDVVISNNDVKGDMCILIDGDWRTAASVPRRVTVTGNNLTATYAGVHVNTHDGPGPDSGNRVTDVTVSGNLFSGTGIGVNLSRARASITGNTFLTAQGISNFNTGDVGASLITGNTFRTRTGGIYNPGTGSLIDGNIFEGIRGEFAVYLGFHAYLRGNSFANNQNAVVLRTPNHDTARALVESNVFTDNTRALDIGEYARSFALLNNTFIGNTVTASIIAASPLNSLAIGGNRVLSGAPFPTVGSGDGEAIIHTEPVALATSLPPPHARFRGRLIRLEGSGATADQAYICRRNAAGAFEWAPVL